jgi:hypothetical protein
MDIEIVLNSETTSNSSNQTLEGVSKVKSRHHNYSNLSTRSGSSSKLSPDNKNKDGTNKTSALSSNMTYLNKEDVL